MTAIVVEQKRSEIAFPQNLAIYEGGSKFLTDLKFLKATWVEV
jgi:hypothetical protein